MSQMIGGEGKKIDFGKFIIAKLKRNNKISEMVVDPIKAWNTKILIGQEMKKRSLSTENAEALTIEDLKKMPDIDINDIFEGLILFEDAKKGDVYPNSFLEEMFKTVDPINIAYQFLLDPKTEWNWTKAQREEFSKKKRKQIVNLLAKNAINPQTKKPHPPQRIEKAIKEAKYNIDMNKSAEEQIKDVIHAISAIIPIKMENVELAVKIPASFAAKAYGTVEKYGRVKQSEWQNDGSWVGVTDLPAGLEAEFLDKINKLTHGRGQIKILKRS
ncbi:MAG: ribosome assembly factor SBDS [archaeon]|nr:ribosome assembly factor SBDS [archaeon]